MFLKKPRFLILSVLVSSLFSCSEYQKALKSDEIKVKFDLAEKLYEEGDYKRANRLYEQIAPQYVGKPQGERVVFFFANTYFQRKDYNMAAYQFERFLKSYPKSEKAPEAAFLVAKSYYMLSPRYSLDQTDTDKALVKLQNFINVYAESEYFDEANAMAMELTTKKERKSFEIAKQYTKLGKSYILEFNISAIAAWENFISDYPGSIYREDAYYHLFEASSNLAMFSTEFRKKERLESAISAYQSLLRHYPDTKHQKDAEDMVARLEREMRPYTANESK